MKTYLALALAGLAAAAPTATSPFNGIRETFSPRPSGNPAAIRPFPFTTNRLNSYDRLEKSGDTPILNFPARPLLTLSHPPHSSRANSAIQSHTSPAQSSTKPILRLDKNLSTFKHAPGFSLLASSAPAPYPYTLVFSDHNATAIHQPIETHIQRFYDASECAAHCNEHRACRAFGLFVERQPTCEDCEFPEFWEANVCELYNTRLERRVVTDGEREEVVAGERYTRAVRASNGYNRLREGAWEGDVWTESQTVRATQTVTVAGAKATETVTVVGPASIRTVTYTFMAPGSTVTATHTVIHTSTAPDVTKTFTHTVTGTHTAPGPTVTTTRTIHDHTVVTTTTKQTETTTQHSAITVLGFASPTTTTETVTVTTPASSPQQVPSSSSSTTSLPSWTPPTPASPSTPTPTMTSFAPNTNVLTITKTRTSTTTMLHTMTRPMRSKPSATAAGHVGDSESSSDSNSDSDSDSHHKGTQGLGAVSRGVRTASRLQRRSESAVTKGYNSETPSDSDRPGGSDYDSESDEDIWEWVGGVASEIGDALGDIFSR